MATSGGVTPPNAIDGTIPPHGGAGGRQHVAFSITPEQLQPWRERLTARGVTTGPIPHGVTTLAASLDVFSSELVLECSDGRTQRIEIDGFRIYVLHILAELNPQAADNVDAVIYGHSHQPKIETTNGTLFFNPGSAGPRRFRLPITVGRMTVEHGKLHAEIVELSVEK